MVPSPEKIASYRYDPRFFSDLLQASGFYPRKSEIWAKINNLRQKIIEKAHGNSASGRSQAIAYCNNSALSKEAAHCIFGEDGSPSSPSSVYCHELKPANSSPIRRCFSLENDRRHNSFLGRRRTGYGKNVATAPERLGQGLAEELWRSGQP